MGPLKSTAPLLALLVASAVLSLLPLAQSASSTFPSFSQYAGRPYSVTYDRRSIRLNDQPVVFMSGSIHYPRSTPGMWPSLMRAAAADGMNMIEIYVFWNYHEVVEGQFDWSGRGNLTLFLDTIAEAGLFANLRIGPYVCAEWDYGGIPSFLGYREGMRMRTYNQPWMDAVQSWFGRVIAETRGYFADRGGPIVLAQVENELYGAPDAYVQWNGDMAASFNVGVPWIMCNGQSANNTINACNGNDCAGFIDGNGQSGRILIDQPALWTENEGWFQQWGQETYPTMLAGTDRSPEEMAFVVSRWFARGGSHMNYYMYHGGNHYGRTAADGLTNKYADGVNFHSDGLPNEPKKSHLMRVHQAIAAVSGDLLAHAAQSKKGVVLPWRADPSQPWTNGTQQLAFVYGQTVFIESSATVYVQAQYNGKVYDLAPNSLLLLSADRQLLNTSDVAPATVERVNTAVWDAPLEWSAWREGPYSFSEATASQSVVKSMYPREMLNLTGDLTEYAWYVATRQIDTAEPNAKLTIDAGTGSSFLVFWDEKYVDTCYNYDHDGVSNPWQCTVSLGDGVTVGSHSLALLSVSLGIGNGVGSGDPVSSHFKGVRSNGTIRTGAHDFTRGQWVIRPYLTGELLAVYSEDGRGSVQWTSQWKGLVGQSLVWWTAEVPRFAPPADGAYAVLLDASGMGRGHAYINGNDLGKYWLITPKGSAYPTQWLYHIPPDWINWEGSNWLTLGEELGGDPTSVRIVISQMLPKQPSAQPHVQME